jgi:hypothetical protein
MKRDKKPESVRARFSHAKSDLPYNESIAVLILDRFEADGLLSRLDPLQVFAAEQILVGYRAQTLGVGARVTNPRADKSADNESADYNARIRQAWFWWQVYTRDRNINPESVVLSTLGLSIQSIAKSEGVPVDALTKNLHVGLTLWATIRGWTKSESDSVQLIL